ncbi:MAG: MoaD/ThiS family protein [Candidatus Thorarchaeota archaeon]
MSVIVELFGILARTAGTKEVAVEVSDSLSVEQLINNLGTRFGDKFNNLLIDKESRDLVPLVVLINGTDRPWHETRTKQLIAGDKVTILLPIAGG